MMYFIINTILNFLPLSLLLIFTFYINIFIYKLINLFKFSIEKIIDINNNIKKNNKLCKKLKNKIKLINFKIDNYSQNILNKNILETKIDELKINITNSHLDNFNRNNEENSYLNLTETLKMNDKINTNNFELLNKITTNSILQNTLLELST